MSSDLDRSMDLRSKESEVSSSGLENDKKDVTYDSISDPHDDTDPGGQTGGRANSSQRPPHCPSLSPPPAGGSTASAPGDSIQESVAKVCGFQCFFENNHLSLK